MNERIGQLKEQARDFYLLQEDLDCSIKELHELVDTKFAELLILECIDIVANKTWGGSDLAIKEMKQRFGVEL